MSRAAVVLAAFAAAALLAGASRGAPTSIDLPFDASEFADLGPGAPSPEKINDNCRACHSANMVLNQPRLSRGEWAAEVAKMRNVYKAPVAESDDAAIIDWLVAMSEKRAG